MSQFKKLNKRNSTVFNFANEQFRTIQNPIRINNETYSAVALYYIDNEYEGEWERINFNSLDGPGACDWDNPLILKPSYEDALMDNNLLINGDN
ncbi:hypothetical protein [Jeotgalibacillus proteolyticus]|uniref:hypothetical protein n=1 Tax=Jeotgalibacillus proteolyticus TaxID=2082395 RepID=UPI003CE6B72C